MNQHEEIHGAAGDRTPDLYSAIVALSQLSYCPVRRAIVAHTMRTVKPAAEQAQQVALDTPYVAPLAGEQVAPLSKSISTVAPLVLPLLRVAIALLPALVPSTV